MIKYKSEKGAITLYILVALLFFIIALVNVQVNLKSKESRIEDEYQKIKVGYQIDANEVYDGMTFTPSFWRYKQNNDKQIIVTNGTIELRMGDYINYNPKAKDAKESQTFSKSYTVQKGTSISSTYTAVVESPVQGSGYTSTQSFNNSATTNGWRVFGCDESTGELLITSADPITSRYLYLKGYTGYHYAETELQSICDVYGQGYGATRARSINSDDIDKITGFNPNNMGVYDPNQTGSGTKYGSSYIYQYNNIATYSWNTTANGIKYSGSNGKSGTGSNSNYGTYGFNWYDETTGKWKISTQDTTNPQEITKVTSTYYSYYYPYTLSTTSSTTGTQIGLSITSPEYLTIFCNSSETKVSYWLSSPYIYASTSYIYYGIRTVSSGRVYYNHLFRSYAYNSSSSAYVRPIVYLKPDLKLGKTGTNTDSYNEYQVYDIIR